MAARLAFFPSSAMLLLRALLLGLIVCVHVIGGAVLFRHFFRRESPWWGFFLPSLALISALNFIEHFVALPSLNWILPFSLVGLTWLLIRPGFSWKGLTLPSVLFLGSFLFCFAIRCMEPDVNFYNTEGLTDLNRILDFCLGDKIPPTDCWLPPYPHAGYYTFMQYGASVLKRLLGVDIGTSYNVAFALVNALTLLACAAAAYGLSRYRAWVAILTLLVVAGGFTGSTVINLLCHPENLDPAGSIDIGNNWNDPKLNEFSHILAQNPPAISFRLYPPGCYLYYSEFHATQGGHFLTLLTLFAAVETLRRKRTLWPWIFLLLAPFLAILTCTWFFFIVGFVAGPTLVWAWWINRWPSNGRYVIGGAVGGLLLLWPTLDDFTSASVSQPFYWADLHTDARTVLIQWWPVYLPWLLLCFAWPRLTVTARWLHFLILPIFIFTELIFFTDRQTCLEKTWGGVYGLGMGVLYPVLFIQRGAAFRTLTGVIVLTGMISACAWTWSVYLTTDWAVDTLRLHGDSFLQSDPARRRLVQVLGRIRGQTVLTGRSQVAFF
jgi:hypothetical protein